MSASGRERDEPIRKAPTTFLQPLAQPTAEAVSSLMTVTTIGPAAPPTRPTWTSRIDSIPTLPTVAGRLIELALSEDSSAIEIGELISKDPGLTAKLLKVVHSTSFGLRTEVSSVSHAISIVGRQALRSLVLGISISDTLKGRDSSGPNPQEALWKHAVATAAAARFIAESVGKVNSEEAYIAGLMHDIGKVALELLRSAEYQKVAKQMQENGAESDCALEEKYCGMDHTAVGAILAERWTLPAGLRAAVQYHHDPAMAANQPTPIRRIIAITNAADIVAYRCGYPSVEGMRPPLVDKVTQELLARVNESTIIQRVKEDVQKCAEVFRYGEPDNPEIWRKRLYSANAELSTAFGQVAETQRIQKKSTELIIQTQKLLGEQDLIGLVLKETVEKLGFDRAYFYQLSEDTKKATLLHFCSVDGRGTELQGKQCEIDDADLFAKPEPMFVSKGTSTTTDRMLQMLGVNSAVLTPIADESKMKFVLGTDRGAKSVGDATTVDLMVHQLFAPSLSLLLTNDRLYKEARHLAVTDVLTGVSNRRSLMESLAGIVKKHEEGHASFCVAMFDIDYFKKFNDTCGHLAGDEILHSVAQTIRSTSRSYDLVGRYGGEEFCVILPNTSPAEGQGIAERIRMAVEKLGKATAAKFSNRAVTVSGGIASSKLGEKYESLLGRADAALYRAKQNGRNRMESAKETEK